jgi:hypothetical protein
MTCGEDVYNVHILLLHDDLIVVCIQCMHTTAARCPVERMCMCVIHFELESEWMYVCMHAYILCVHVCMFSCPGN